MHTQNNLNKEQQSHPIPLNTITFQDHHIHGCITLRTLDAPEQGNIALHVCQNPDDVMQNRYSLEQDTLPLDRWCLAHQRHTGHVVRVLASDTKKGAYCADSAIDQTDGLYTTDPNVLIGVFTADCLGILVYDEQHSVIGAVHSGWKGTVQAIVANFLRSLQQDGLLYPESLHVKFSPSLMPNSLEVGPEVVSQMEEMAKREDISLEGCIFPGLGDRSYLDHQQINAQFFKKFGIPSENIEFSSLDTKTNPQCYSYRRDGKDCGEHFSCIWMDEKK